MNKNQIKLASLLDEFFLQNPDGDDLYYVLFYLKSFRRELAERLLASEYHSRMDVNLLTSIIENKSYPIPLRKKMWKIMSLKKINRQLDLHDFCRLMVHVPFLRKEIASLMFKKKAVDFSKNDFESFSVMSLLSMIATYVPSYRGRAIEKLRARLPRITTNNLFHLLATLRGAPGLPLMKEVLEILRNRQSIEKTEEHYFKTGTPFRENKKLEEVLLKMERFKRKKSRR